MRSLGEAYGGRKGLGPSAPLAAAGIVTAVLVVTVAWALAEKPAKRLEVSTPTGAPCPVASRSAGSPPSEPARRSAVGGVTFARDAGAVVCDVEGGAMQETVAKGDTVLCQFSAPGALSVRTARGRFDWQPAPGEVASVIVAHGQPRCVLAAPYWTTLSQSITEDMHAPGS